MRGGTCGRAVRGLGACAAFAVALTGCSIGRPPVIERLKAADGRSYYIFETGYRCSGFGPGEPIPSWKDRIDIREGKLIAWGDRCANAGIPLDDARAAQARVSRDLSRLTVGGATYVFAADPDAAGSTADGAMR